MKTYFYLQKFPIRRTKILLNSARNARLALQRTRIAAIAKVGRGRWAGGRPIGARRTIRVLVGRAIACARRLGTTQRWYSFTKVDFGHDLALLAGSAARQVPPLDKLVVVHHPEAAEVILVANEALVQREICADCVLLVLVLRLWKGKNDWVGLGEGVRGSLVTFWRGFFVC
jgi:hypothetical protein